MGSTLQIKEGRCRKGRERTTRRIRNGGIWTNTKDTCDVIGRSKKKVICEEEADNTSGGNGGTWAVK